jgi:two-component system, OmpR family, sensor histidine kinase KdpD
MIWLDPKADLANLALVLVLGAAVATLWLPAVLSVVASTVAVFVFNWMFVSPRGHLNVEVHQDALLLSSMLMVTWIVAGLMAVQRDASDRAREHARQTEQLRDFSEVLRDAPDPLVHADLLQKMLSDLNGAEVKLLVVKPAMLETDHMHGTMLLGVPSADQVEALWRCVRGAKPLAPATGRDAALTGWHFPMRGRAVARGAALVPASATRVGADRSMEADLRSQTQALCDQFGLALERSSTAQAAIRARDLAQTQNVRSAMLAAISHDYRTPLATILGAASSLTEQGPRLDHEQRNRLARTIVEEVTQLSRLTDNMLQLARLYAPGMRLLFDWESAEELVGEILRRVRRHDPHRRVRATLQAGLPLVRCDALLLSQMLDNLVDNALKYSASDAPVEIAVRREAGSFVFAVIDQGRGVHPDWRERIFEAFERGVAAEGSAVAPIDSSAARRGAGVGLTVCRAIARAHGGELTYRPREGGGSLFEFRLPEGEPPSQAEEARQEPLP